MKEGRRADGRKNECSGTQRQTKISFIPKQMTPAKKISADEELAKMIAMDFQPFSIVEDKGFKAFVQAINPTYVLPSRKTLSQKMIPQLFNTERAFKTSDF